jgi:hypothetical protein
MLGSAEALRWSLCTGRESGKREEGELATLQVHRPDSSVGRLDRAVRLDRMVKKVTKEELVHLASLARTS